MIEDLVKLRRKVRPLRNLLQGKFLEKTEYLDTRLMDAITQYAPNNKVKLFCVDSDGLTTMFTANNYSDSINHTEIADKVSEMEHTKIRHQIFSRKNKIIEYLARKSKIIASLARKNSVTNYYDEDCWKDNYKFKMMAKIEEQ
jgi:hypothetical protein